MMGKQSGQIQMMILDIDSMIPEDHLDMPRHADLILAGITQLITMVLADKIYHLEYIRSLKPLIA